MEDKSLIKTWGQIQYCVPILSMNLEAGSIENLCTHI